MKKSKMWYKKMLLNQKDIQTTEVSKKEYIFKLTFLVSQAVRCSPNCSAVGKTSSLYFEDT